LASADRELQTLRVQKSLLEAEEQHAYARLRAHEDFLTQLDNPDEALTRRLAAAELNLMPADEEPVLRLITYELPTVEWIDRTVERPVPKTVLASHSKLAELATGPYRLWLFGAGIMCVFMGLLLDPGVKSIRKIRTTVDLDIGNDTDMSVAVAELDREDIEREEVDALLADVDAASQDEAFEAIEEDDEDASEEEGEADVEDEYEVEVEDEDEVEEELVDETEDDLIDEVVDDVDEADEEDEAWDEEDAADEDGDEDFEEDSEPVDADEEYELIADDVELVEVIDDDEDSIDEAEVDPFDVRPDEPERVTEVISIRPSMSVGAPAADDDAAADLFAANEDDDSLAQQPVESSANGRRRKR